MRITLLLISYAFLVSLAVLVEAWAPGPQRQGSTGLSVSVQPEAKLTVEAVDPPGTDSLRETIQWFRVDFAVRVHAGATAALFLEHFPRESGPRSTGVPGMKSFVKLPENASHIERGVNDSRSLFTVRKSGRYSLLVGIGIDDYAAEDEFSDESVQFVLKSSDGILHLTKTVPVNRGHPRQHSP